MKASRRIMLKNLAVIGGLAAAPRALQPALAQAKASKQTMQYQEQPKNGQKCDSCVQFIPGAKPGASGACKVVDGPVSPNGWCIAYVKKS